MKKKKIFSTSETDLEVTWACQEGEVQLTNKVSSIPKIQIKL
jgi:hypothetical protein